MAREQNSVRAGKINKLMDFIELHKLYVCKTQDV